MANTTQRKANNMRKEMAKIAGDWSTYWIVVTIAANGDYTHIETFHTEAEALSWIKWA